MRAHSLRTLLLLGSLAASARAGIVDPTIPSAEDGAGPLAVSGDTLFVAGPNWLGPHTDGGVPLETSDLSTVAGFPRVKGVVRAAAADGAGGWYIGGQFTHVGGLERTNLAHVQGDLSVGTWAPTTDLAVRSLVVTASDVYLSGSFGAVNGTARTRLARVDRASGALASWDPQPNGDVNALASDGATLYVGGAFTSIALVARNGAAAFDLAGNALLPWDPVATSISQPTTIWSLRCGNGVVYASGNFNQISGSSRNGLAALDPTSSAPRAWNPSVSGQVLAILPIGGTVYLGGLFTGGLVAVDTTGVQLPWQPFLSGPPGYNFPTVNVLEQVGSDVLAGGLFGRTTFPQPFNLARIHGVSGAHLPTPACPREVFALATSGARVFVGGAFKTLGSSMRRHLAAVRISTGTLLAWAPGAKKDPSNSPIFDGSVVSAMAVDATRVYVARNFFDIIMFTMRSDVMAFSRATGGLVWGRPFDGTVEALALSDTRLLAGGSFTETANRLAALDAATGAIVAWGASATGGDVHELLPTPVGLAVAGTFTSAGGQPRARIAMLDPVTGLATGWDPGADGTVSALALSGSTLYCGGDFLNAGGVPRSRVAAIDLASGTATDWNPGADGLVTSLAADGATVFASGTFTTFGGQPLARLAAATTSGSVLTWWPPPAVMSSAAALSLTSSRVFVSGSQTGAADEPTVGLTALQHPGTLLDAPAPPPPSARLTLRVDPQPLRSHGRIKFSLPRSAPVELDLFDLHGRRVARVEPRRLRDAGEHTVEMSPRDLAAGLYLLRITTPEATAQQKVIVLP